MMSLNFIEVMLLNNAILASHKYLFQVPVVYYRKIDKVQLW